MKTQKIENTLIHYLFDLGPNILTYQKMKKKHGHALTNLEKDILKKDIMDQIILSDILKDVEIILTPESSHEFFLEILHDLATELKKSVLIIPKRNKEQVLSSFENDPMMKAERKKLTTMISNMETVKMNLIAGNQRKRVAHGLFDFDDIAKKLHDKKVLLMDDSFFSGHTLKVITSRLGISEALVLFMNH